MIFEYYVLNYDHNKKETVLFNIFNNWKLNEETEKAVKRYIELGNEYTRPIYKESSKKGFDGFCDELYSLICWQERGRMEYEIAVGDIFSYDLSHFSKWDCAQQCEPNIYAIAREVIFQYKENNKKGRKNK